MRKPTGYDGFVVTPHEVFDAQTLFDRARGHLDGSRYREAARDYDLLVASFPQSDLVAPTLYNAGLAYERLADFRTAEVRYGRLIALVASGQPLSAHGLDVTQTSVDALFRRGACLAELDEYPASDEIFRGLLLRTDLSLEDRLEAMTRRGFAAYKMGQAQEAERRFQDVISYYEAHEEEERMESTFFLAMAQFHIGQLAEDRFLAAPLRLPEPVLAQDLEDKARRLLTAQHRYLAVVRRKNPHWASAAGYRIASMYRALYEAIVEVPVPPELTDPEAISVYREEVRRKLRPLLEKALRTHTQSLEAAKRAGIDNDYVKRSQVELARLQEYLRSEEP